MASGRRVVVVTGTGGMGKAAGRRIALGATLILADIDSRALAAAAADLRQDGFEVVEHQTDVADLGSLRSLAEAATAEGRVEALVHTAGLSPVQAPAPAILSVDLVGTALVLDVFAEVIEAGGAGVCIASMAGTMAAPAFSADFERRLMTTPTDQLLELPELSEASVPDAGTAYGLAKRANQLRVRAAAPVWGRRGARVNSISPGVISTPMGVAELAGPSGELMRTMVAGSATGRIGTPEDIAAAVAFLTGPDSTFVTGTDLLVDGGVVATLSSASP